MAESLRSPSAPASGAVNLSGARTLADCFVVPAGVSALVPRPGQPPEFTSMVSPELAHGVLIEPTMSSDKRLQLVLVNRGKREVRVNETVAPRVALLREGDRFRLDQEAAFHVCLYRRPRVALAAHLGVAGKTCPVCLLPLQEDDVCYACVCGTAYQCNPPPTGKLECARTLSRCITCQRELVLQGGFVRLPDLAHE